MLSVPSNHRLPREQYRWLVFIFILAPLDSTVGLIASPASAQLPANNCLRTLMGFLPLSDMTAAQDYFGQESGLYGYR